MRPMGWESLCCVVCPVSDSCVRLATPLLSEPVIDQRLIPSVVCGNPCVVVCVQVVVAIRGQQVVVACATRDEQGCRGHGAGDEGEQNDLKMSMIN